MCDQAPPALPATVGKKGDVPSECEDLLTFSSPPASPINSKLETKHNLGAAALTLHKASYITSPDTLNSSSVGSSSQPNPTMDNDDLSSCGQYRPIEPTHLSTPVKKDHGFDLQGIPESGESSLPIPDWNAESPPGIPVLDIANPTIPPLYSSPSASVASSSDNSASQDHAVSEAAHPDQSTDISKISHHELIDHIKQDIGDAQTISECELIIPQDSSIGGATTELSPDDSLDETQDHEELEDAAEPCVTPENTDVAEGVEELIIHPTEKPKPAIMQSYLDSLPSELSHRNLARLARIERLDTRKVDGKTVAVATVDAWEIVVPPPMFVQGELVLLLEKDCFVPASQKFVAATGTINQGKLDALWSHARKETVDGIKGKVIQAHLTSGMISEGLIFPLQSCNKVVELLNATKAYHSDAPDPHARTLEMATDFRLADWLGVTKWTVPTKTKGDILGATPAFIPTASLNRLAKMANKILTDPKYLKVKYQETVKLDGATMHTYFIKKDSKLFRTLRPLGEHDATESMVLTNGRFGVCSHNTELKDEKISAYWEMAHQYGLPDKLNNLNRNVVVSGELVGSTVSGNHEGYANGKHDFFVFRLHDLDTGKDLTPAKTVEWAGKLGLKHVPVRGEVTLRQLGTTLAGLEKHAEETGREGLVYRSLVDGRTFKLLNKQWTWYNKT